LFRLLGDGVKGKWIRLHLDRAGFLANALWELLHDGHDFLAVQPSIAISRALERERAVSPAHEEPLRLLVTISSPSDLHALDVEREAQLLRDAFEGLEWIGRAEVHIASDRIVTDRSDDLRQPRPATLDTLLRMLRVVEQVGRSYNAWHFI